MFTSRQVSFFTVSLRTIGAGFLFLVAFSSCMVVKKGKYPVNKPFVYKTSISVTGNLSQAEKQDMVTGLQNQLDDSLKTRIVSYAGIRKVLSNPPVFDTINISRSKKSMAVLLNLQGYFYPVIKDTFRIDTIKDRQQASISFQVFPGKQTHVDSVGYSLRTPALQQMAIENSSNGLVRKDDPYSEQTISNEVDRLVSIFRNNGYFKVSRNDIYAEVDTVVAALIDPTLDPFEQIRLLDSLRKKLENPTINVVFKQRGEADSNHIRQYYIRNVRVYPDQPIIPDSSLTPSMTRLGKFSFFTNTQKFRLPFVARNIALLPDSMYRERNYFRTVNNFNRLGAWQNVEVTLYDTVSDAPLLDADIRLYPAQKYNLKVDLEASRNVADYLTTSQFFGLGLNLNVTNRNLFRESVHSSRDARAGVEFGSNFIQTLQGNISQTLLFPRFVLPFKLNSNQITNDRTIFNINAAYTIRREIYNVASVNSSWSYEWTKRRWNFQFTPINVEYTKLDGKDSLFKLINQIPSLRYAFNDGFVIGMIAGVNTVWSKKNKLSNFKFRVEESGAIFGFVKKLEDNNLFRFVKLDAEYKHFINYKKSAWAFRGFLGYGYVYGKKDGAPERNLPFFKAYFAGGPYSMRGWGVRRLGPGSSLLYDTTNNQPVDRFGNMQLEANVEYRFDLTRIAGIKVKSAVFADMGNIWSNEYRDANASSKIEEASFSLKRLGKDLAIAGGVSLRFDFDYFLIRLDWAYQLKNPRYKDFNNGWFHDLRLFDGQFQLGINYPF